MVSGWLPITWGTGCILIGNSDQDPLPAGKPSRSFPPAFPTHTWHPSLARAAAYSAVVVG
eukprot:939601-Pyramimonas_sp.AAC.1